MTSATNEDTARICPSCGSAIPVDAPGSACPACELRSAFSSGDDLEGQTIGRYKILSRIGTGGFGVVYLAHQSEPVQRKVAVKILKRERISDAIVAQFISEQQTLAMMNHPNIAKIFDAGETDWGAPYFVMELIEGEPITDYCDRKKLTPNERILVFRDVCGAVQHAHQKAIIHRDIKPNNVLVVELDDEPVPKIIDFGVAKAVGTPLGEMVASFANYPVVGTPEYMPPEQARGEADIDTRADIYSLGVLLYELLIGTPPFSRKEIRDAGLAAILKMIEEEPHPSPSERLNSMMDRGASVALNRHIDAPELRRVIRGDLDWIVMKSIEKSRKWRYQSTTALAQDIDSYLQHRPLATRGNSIAYRLRKFVRRNRMQVGAAAAVTLVGAAGAGVALILLSKQRAAEADAIYRKLFEVEIESVPSVIASIGTHTEYLDPRLEEVATSDSDEVQEDDRARAQLALLSRQPQHFSALLPWLLQATPSELPVSLSLIGSGESELASLVWSILTDDTSSAATGLRAAAIGTFADPQSPRWDDVADRVTGFLVTSGPFEAARWIPLLRPISTKLEPSMRVLFRDAKDTPTGEMAAFVLSDLFENDLDELVALTRAASPRQLPVIGSVLARRPELSVPRLVGELGSPTSENAAEAIAESLELSSIGVALLILGQWDLVKPEFERRPEPDVRTHIIHRAPSSNVEWRLFADSLAKEEDAGVIMASLTSLAGYDAAQIPPTVRTTVQPEIERLFSTHPDPGVHSAAGWLLEQWGLDQNLSTLSAPNQARDPQPGMDWYVTSDGQITMAILPSPIALTMGSPAEEREREIEMASHRPDNEQQQEIQINRRIAVSTKEITLDQFTEFSTALKVEKKSLIPNGWKNPVSRSGDAAMSFVSLKEAMLFCWWLTKKEGIPDEEQCYTFDGTVHADADPSTVDGYLLKTGYRILTEPEWEFACRGGTTTARYFGDDPTYLPEYERFGKNSEDRAWRPGMLRPNPYGLFDMLGNVAEWCQERYHQQYQLDPEGSVISVGEPTYRGEPREGSWTVYRGSAFLFAPRSLRSARRVPSPYPAQPISGFRIARTISN